MPLLKRLHSVDREIEKKILTGLIISDKVLEKLQPLLQNNIFDMDVSNEVLKWILNYYSKYKKSPQGHIKDLFFSAKIRPQISVEIEQFLSKLSEEYLSEAIPDGSGLNEQFIIDRGIQYLREQHLKQTVAEVSSLMSLGHIDEAENLLHNKKNIIEKAEYRWVKPLDDVKYITSVFEEKESPLLTFKGSLGELVGPIYRGWLIGVMGPFKRGKSWALQDLAFDGVLSKRKVVLISLEMANIHQSVRIYSQIGQLGDVERSYDMPCFDCASNQNNACHKPERLKICHEARPKSFKIGLSYMPCTLCRGTPHEEDFIVTTWFTVQKRPALTRKNIRKEISKLQKMVGRNTFRLISYPAFSATLSDVENDLERLEVHDGFIPDMIIIDYADILAPESKQKDVRHQIDEIWKRLKGMAYERSCVVISGSQGNRASTDKEVLDEKDIAEEARKLAHADIWISLNQTPKEKEHGVWRLGILEHRWRKFNKRQQLMALQQFELGQPILDSEMIYYSYEKEKKF